VEAGLEVPLYTYGDRVKGYTLVSEDDYERVMQYRWHFAQKGRYVARTILPTATTPKDSQLLHRFILGLEVGDDLRVDHINGNGIDNRRSNLRVGSQRLNLQNTHGRGTSEYRGVSFREDIGKWKARAMLDGREYFLGYFASEIEAAKTASAWRAVNMPWSPDARGEGPFDKKAA
jgi:hypothetical protein